MDQAIAIHNIWGQKWLRGLPGSLHVQVKFSVGYAQTERLTLTPDISQAGLDSECVGQCSGRATR